MRMALIGLFGVIIGAVISFIGNLLTERQRFKLEKKRMQRADMKESFEEILRLLLIVWEKEGNPKEEISEFKEVNRIAHMKAYLYAPEDIVELLDCYSYLIADNTKAAEEAIKGDEIIAKMRDYLK